MPPNTRPASFDDATLATCAAHSGMEATLLQIREMVGTVSSGVTELQGTVAGLAAGSRGLRHDFNDMRDQIRSLPVQIADNVRQHEAGCLAAQVQRQRAMDEATGVHRLHGRAVPARDSLAPSERGGLRIPRWLLYAGIGVGIALAAGGWALSLLLKVNFDGALDMPATGRPAIHAPSTDR